MGKFNDLTGERFGRLTVLGIYGNDKYGKLLYRCWCDCGNERITHGRALKSGHCRSCGCLNYDVKIEMSKYKGIAQDNPRLYTIWKGMNARCFNERHKSFKDYGAKGIAVCEDWKHFEPFKEWALSHGYADDLTIDRIDVSKGYSPDNCRWVSVREQNNNQARTLWLTYNGETMQLSYWADRLGINYHTLYDRLYLHGWSIEKAFNTPVRRST